ncbi:MAG: Cadherin domain protein [Planctomycetaceae bacterium]|nr:Cadherin domain protein [Planctomycetaceae bacterium]
MLTIAAFASLPEVCQHETRLDSRSLFEEPVEMKPHAFNVLWSHMWNKPLRRRRRQMARVEQLEERIVLTNIFAEGFEGQFPEDNNWSTTTSLGRVWDDSNDKAHSGGWSGFSSDLINGSDQTSYLNNEGNSFSKVVDLTNFRDVDLTFWRFINTEATHDGLRVSIAKNGVGVTTALKSGNLQSWVKETIAVPDELLGQSGVTITFSFIADGSVIPASPAGVWVDDISLDGLSDPGFPLQHVTPLTGPNLRLSQLGDVSTNGTIGSSTERDVYAFGVDVTGSYTITAGNGAVDTELRVYDAQGDALTAVIDSSFSEEQTTLNFTSGTTIYIVVGGYQAGTGTYTLTVNGPSSTPVVPSLSANFFEGNGSGAIGFAGDRDYYSFTAPAHTSTMTLNVSPSAGLDPFLALFNSSGTLLLTRDANNTGVDETITNFAVTPGQTYTLMVAGFSISEGDAASESYTYTVDFDPDYFGDPPATITPGTGTNLRLNQLSDISGVTGSILTDTDFRTYGFDVDVAGSYTITVDGDATLDAQLRVYDANGNPLTGIIDLTGTSFSETTTLALSGGAAAYFVVSGWHTTTGSFTVSVNGPTTSTPALSTPAPNYFNINSASIGYAGDRDYYSITAPNGTTKLSITLIPSNGLDPVLSLFDSQGNKLIQLDNGGTGTTETLTNFAITAGETYVVMASGFNMTEGANGAESYSYNIDFSPDLSDVNVAPVIAVGQVLSILENSLANDVVGTVAASDANSSAPNNVITYSILSGSPTNPFSINAATGQITVTNPVALDYETTTQFVLQVKATDGGNLSDTQAVTINVTDVNEVPSIDANQVFQINENSALNAVVGTVLASDPDINQAFKTLTYSITGGNTGNAFFINATTGQLTVNTPAAVDFETTPTFNLTISVIDGGALSTSQTVEVDLQNVNEAPTITGVPITPPVFVGKVKTPVAVFPSIGISDPDGPTDLAVLVIRVQLPAVKKNPDVISFAGAGGLGVVQDSIVGGFRQFTINLNSNTTSAQVEAFLKDITFSTKGAGLSKKNMTRQFHVTVTDKQNVSSNTVSQVVNVRKK